MVKQEIIFWRYLFKDQFIFLSLPLIIWFLAIIIKLTNTDLALNFITFVGFPIAILPISALLFQIGSTYQKELLLTFPLNNFVFGLLRPFFLSVFYSIIFAFSLKFITNYENNLIFSAAISLLLLMTLASFFLILFKNIALGILLPFIYLFFGMFTTGMGQGSLYLMQWARSNPDLSIINCIITQILAIILFSFWGFYLLKNRNKYTWSE